MSRPGLNLSLYLVTDTERCGELGVPATVEAAVTGGVSVVQVRDAACSDDDFVALGRAVATRLVGTGIPLLVNDRVHLADEIGAHGAHIGQHDLDVAAARRLLGPARYLGLSVQTTAHVDAAAGAEPGLIDYLGVGPVWPQSTKPDGAAPGGLDQLAAVVARSHWPCVAIGGVTAGRVRLVRRAGAQGIAVVSAICGHHRPAAAAARLLAEWNGADDESDLWEQQ